jgi:3-methyladenine DNA glycosylase/8-oxoguanine DNA glycosylase
MSGVHEFDSVFIPMPTQFSLARTCAPAAWSGGRWPNEDWIDGAFWWAGHEAGAACWRSVTQANEGVIVSGTGDPDLFPAWARRVLAPQAMLSRFADPVISEIEQSLPGLGHLNSGDMADGATFAVIGQSVSLASAGVTAARLCTMFHPGFSVANRTLWPLPRAEDLAESDPATIRPCGVTGRRAEAIVAVARLFASGDLPSDPTAFNDAHAARLLAAPGVGPWTVASTLIWGGGHSDTFPPGDAALLRAARAAYGLPELDHRALAERSRGWGTQRATAARLLWTDLFGHPGDRFTPARHPRTTGVRPWVSGC